MNELEPQHDPLDDLLEKQPTAEPPADFVARVMTEVTRLTMVQPFWQRDWVQWLLLSGTLALAIGRLAGFIFGSWIVIQLAG